MKITKRQLRRIIKEQISPETGPGSPGWDDFMDGHMRTEDLLDTGSVEGTESELKVLMNWLVDNEPEIALDIEIRPNENLSYMPAGSQDTHEMVYHGEVTLRDFTRT